MNIQTIQQFKDKTGYDIQAFFEDYVLFVNGYYSLIVSYYNGEDVDVLDAFGQLDNLMQRATQIEPLFAMNSNLFNNLDYWELLDVFSDCQTKLWTINNTSKWLRSAIIGRFGPNVVLEKVLKSRETFENAVNTMGAANPQDDWVKVATDNTVEEEAYEADNGGGLFRVNINYTGEFPVDNIVDNLDNKKILGKDMAVALGFANNDIVTVEYEKAVEQSFLTILGTLRGSIPEFPDYGMPSEIIGVSRNALQYPTIFKALVNMFQADGRFIEVNLIDIYLKEDNVFMKINAKTINENYLETSIKL